MVKKGTKLTKQQRENIGKGAQDRERYRANAIEFYEMYKNEHPEFESLAHSPTLESRLKYETINVDIGSGGWMTIRYLKELPEPEVSYHFDNTAPTPTFEEEKN